MASAGAGMNRTAVASSHASGPSLANRSRFQSMARGTKKADLTLNKDVKGGLGKSFKNLAKLSVQEDDIYDPEAPGPSPLLSPGGTALPTVLYDSETGEVIPDDRRLAETRKSIGESNFAALEKTMGIWGGDRDVINVANSRVREKAIADGTANDTDFIATQVTQSVKKWKKTAKRHVKERRYMIDPRARWKLYWDIVCGIFIVFSVIVIPYRLFFRARIAPAAQYLDYFIDALFFFDMVFSFRTGFFAKQGHLVMSPRRIFKGYIRTWFLVDFFSTMPLDTIIFYAFDVPRQQLRTIKLIRILRLARLAKLAKLMTRGSIQLILAMINPALLRLGQLMGVIMFVAHFLSCFWAAVNSCDYKYQYDEDELEDVLFTGFKYNLNYDPFGEVIPGTLISKCGNENSYHLWVSQYLAAFYWVIATMMAVGYGDIYGTTNAERTYAIFVEIVGAGCFGFIISTVTHIVETMSPESRIRKHEMELILEYSKYRNLPRSLHRRLMKHFEYMFQEKSVFDELSVLRRLPVSMRVNLTLAVHESKTTKLKTLFHDLDKHFVAEIILLLRPFVMKVGETIVVSGVVPDQIYVVNTGFLQVSRPLFKNNKGGYVISGLMSDGNVIGLSSAFRNEKMDFKLCAPVKTDMWFIESHELKMVLEYYEEDTENLIVTNDNFSAIADECWNSDVTEIAGVKVRKMIHVEGVAKTASSVDSNLLAGTAALADSGKGETVVGLIKTLKIDPEDKTATIESLETPQDIINRWIFDPGETKKTIWDVSVGLLIIFSVAVVPLRLGFDLPATTPWVIVDWLTDFIFMCDICITFRSAYLDDENTLVTVPEMIKSEYLKLWFWIDLGSTIPIDKIVEQILGGGGGNLRSLKMIRIVRLVRLLKLVKLLKIDMSALEEVVEIDPTVQKTLSLFGMLYGLAHFFGCFWNMATTVEPIYINANLTLFEDPEDVALYDGYIGALYWAFTTMTTVGYGDILPEEDGGRFYATTMMIIGATFFSFIVGSAAAIINNDKNGDKQVKERLVSMYDYCTDRGISRALEKRLKRNLNYQLTERSPFEETYIMDCLPSPLRCELMLLVKKEAMDGISIFHNRDLAFVSCVLQYMTPCQFVDRDVLYYPMVGSRGLYFVINGKLAKCKYKGQLKNSMKSIIDPRLQCIGLPYEAGDFVGFEHHKAAAAGKSATPLKDAEKEMSRMEEADDEFGCMALEITQLYYLSNEALTLILMRRPSAADMLIKSIREESMVQQQRRKAAEDAMNSDELRVKVKELNQIEKFDAQLQKDGLAWASKDKFTSFVRKRSMADGQYKVETELASDQIMRPLLREYKSTQMTSETFEQMIERTKKQIEHGETTIADFDIAGASSSISEGEVAEVAKLGGDDDSAAGRRRSSRRSLSCHVVAVAMQGSGNDFMSDDGSGSFDGSTSTGGDSFGDLSSPSKRRMSVSSADQFKSPAAAEDEDKEAHQTAVVTAIRKAGRRMSHVDPMMGSHGVGHGMNKNSPLVVKHSTVMRPSVSKSPSSRKMTKMVGGGGSQRGGVTGGEGGGGGKQGSFTQRSVTKSYSNLKLEISEAKIEKELGSYDASSSGKGFEDKKGGDKKRRKSRNSGDSTK